MVMPCRDNYQAQVLPALTETILYVETPLDVPLCLYFSAHQVASLLRPDPVESGPARSLTAHWTARADWADGGAGAPPPPPAGGRSRDILGGSAPSGAGAARLQEGGGAGLGHQLVYQGSRGGSLQTILHRVLHLNTNTEES